MAEAVGARATESAESAAAERWRRLVEQAPDAILIHQDDRIVFANRQAAEMFGAESPEALIGRCAWELLHPEDLEIARERTRQVLATGEPARPAELRFRRLDGSYFPAEARPSVVAEGGKPALLAIIRDISDRKRAEAELKASEERFRDYAELSSDWFWEMGPDLRFTWFSDNVQSVLGVPPAQLIGRSRLDLISAEWDRERVRAHLETLRRREPFRDFAYPWRHPSGERRWLSVSGKPIFDEAGRFLGYRGTGRDVTAWREAQLALQESERRYRELVHTSPDAILVHRAGRIIFANQQAADLVGLERPEDFIGRTITEFVVPDDHALLKARWMRLDLGGRVGPAELRIKRPDGSLLFVETRAARITDQGAPAILVVARDVTERRLAEEQLRFLAHHDPLTALPNRTLFRDRLRQALAFARRSGGVVGLLLFDLDGFKGINDSLGHTAGDQLLVAVADRLRRLVRDCDTVCRLGGDEFAVLLPGLRSRRDGLRVARRVMTAVDAPLQIGGHQCRVSASVGFASWPRDGGEADELLAAADLALYAAKSGRRGGLASFQPAMRKAAERRREIERALRAELARAGLDVHYQPVVAVESGAVVGVEALVRWPRRDERVAPDLFVSIAEECGLSGVLTEQVLERACRDIGALRTQHGLDLRLAINLSPKELEIPGLARRLVAGLERCGFPASRLELEITERALLESTPAVLDNVALIRQTGIGLAIDDFGTGYSSLLYLKRLPIHRLKLDRSFVRGLPESAEDAAIVRAVVTLASSFGIPVLAEGVEREEQRAFLLRVGCQEAQGYFFARPLPAEELHAWLAARGLLRRRSPGPKRRRAGREATPALAALRSP